MWISEAFADSVGGYLSNFVPSDWQGIIDLLYISVATYISVFLLLSRFGINPFDSRDSPKPVSVVETKDVIPEQDMSRQRPSAPYTVRPWNWDESSDDEANGSVAESQHSDDGASHSVQESGDSDNDEGHSVEEKNNVIDEGSRKLLRVLGVQTAEEGVNMVNLLRAAVEVLKQQVSDKHTAFVEQCNKVRDLEQELDSQSRFAMMPAPMPAPVPKNDSSPDQMKDGNHKPLKKKLTAVKSVKKQKMPTTEGGDIPVISAEEPIPAKIPSRQFEKASSVVSSSNGTKTAAVKSGKQVAIKVTKSSAMKAERLQGCSEVKESSIVNDVSLVSNGSNTEEARVKDCSDLSSDAMSDRDTASESDNRDESKQSICRKMAEQATELVQNEMKSNFAADASRKGVVSLFCGNLRWSAQECDLKALIESSGCKVETAIILRTAEGKSSGCGFVKVQTSSATNVREACEELSKLKLLGRPMYVEVAKNQRH